MPRRSAIHVGMRERYHSRISRFNTTCYRPGLEQRMTAIEKRKGSSGSDPGFRATKTPVVAAQHGLDPVAVLFAPTFDRVDLRRTPDLVSVVAGGSPRLLLEVWFDSLLGPV
jgi:hypothetical protein